MGTEALHFAREGTVYIVAEIANAAQGVVAANFKLVAAAKTVAARRLKLSEAHVTLSQMLYLPVAELGRDYDIFPHLLRLAPISLISTSVGATAGVRSTKSTLTARSS